jgi:GNAT superfamily N-acetyltransferase
MERFWIVYVENERNGKDMEKSNSITAEEYLEMRQSVGWKIFPLEQASEGLKNTSYICCIRKDNTPIAMGRVIWDHGYVVYIADVIVRPEYQGQGLGREVMNSIMKEIRSYLKPGYRIMISLMAAKGKEEFYKKFDFIGRPNEWTGDGMFQWIEG